MRPAPKPALVLLAAAAACALVAGCSTKQRKSLDQQTREPPTPHADRAQPGPGTSRRGSASTPPVAGTPNEADPTKAAATVAAVTGNTRVSAEDIRAAQSAVMDFTDDFTVRLAEAIDAIEADLPTTEARLDAHRLKYTVAHGATVIAASANPRVALLDMTVMMSLQRALVERTLAPAFGERGARITRAFVRGDEQIRQLAARNFTPEQLAELDALVAQWLKQNPDRKFAAYVRLDDFAAARTQSVTEQSGGKPGSIFGLMFVDPLAGLDPATKEIEQTRLFAERAMFYLQRMPQLVSWQAELLYLDTATEPEVASIVSDISRVSDSVEQITSEMSELRGGLPDLIAREREAAIDQAFSRLSDERAAILDDIAERGPELDRSLAALRETMETARALSNDTKELVSAVDSLRAELDTGEPDPDAPPPPTLDEYRATIDEARELTVQLTELLTAAESVATSDLWETRRKDMEAAADDVESRTKTVIDHAFTKGLVLVGVALGGLLVVLVIVRLIPKPSKA